MSRNRRPVVIEAMENRVMFDAGLLTETIVSSTLPTMTYNESILKGSVTFNMTNTATGPEIGKLAIGIFITGGGLNLGDPSSFAILASKTGLITLSAGASRNYTLSVNIGKGKLALGTDTLYAVAADPDGSDSASPPGPKLTVVAGPPIHFSDKILIAKALYATTSTQKVANELDMLMSIHNTGGLSDGSDQFSLFASTSPTFDSTATKIGHVALSLKVPHGGTRDFHINFNVLPVLANGSQSDYYIFVQVTDTLGDVTQASYLKQIALVEPL